MPQDVINLKIYHIFSNRGPI